jgi:hypothetical protein
MSDIVLGTSPVAVRQKLVLASAFAGLAPQLTGPPIIPFTPHFSNGIYLYRDDAAPPDEEADQGGLFTFGDQPAEIAAIHLDIADVGTPGDINITIEDADGSCVRTIAPLLAIDNYYWTPAAGVRVFLLPFQVMRITAGVAPGIKAAGFKHATVYVVKSYVAGLV